MMQKRVPPKCISAGQAVAYCKATCNTAVLDSVDQRTIRVLSERPDAPLAGRGRIYVACATYNRPRPVQYVGDAPKY